MKKQHLVVLLSTITILTIVSLGILWWIRASPPLPSQIHPQSTSGLHISGNQILDSTGKVFRPLGVNRSGSEYMCDAPGSTVVFDGPSDAASIAAMASWHINTVRIPLNEDCWLGINGFPAPKAYNATKYQQAIVNYVNSLNSHKMAAIIELHRSTPGTMPSKVMLAMPNLDHAPSFWTSVANTFKNNPLVIFDLYNEPHITSWSCWLNGSTAANTSPCSDVDFAVAGMQTLINTVRATNATNIIMVGGLGYANDLSGWLANKPNDHLNNLAASFHLYNYNSCNDVNCWVTNVAPIAAQVPVITGEMGEDDCAHTFIDKAMDWMDQYHIGYLGWAWNTYDCKEFPSLISDYNGTPTAFGQGLRTHLTNLANGKTPSGT